MKEDYKRMLSDVAAQQAQVELDQTNYDRATMLLHSDTVPQANYDQAKAALDVDKSKLESLRQQAAVQLAKLGGNTDIPVDTAPAILCRPRRRSTRRSASSITPSSRRRSAAS